MKSLLTGTFVSSCPDDTLKIARRLAQGLGPGSVIALSGPLGSGKTVFISGIAGGLGLSPRNTSSPTFTLINEYGGEWPLYHVDLYRLDSAAEVAELGLEEYFDSQGIVAIEWAEKASHLLPDRTVTVRIERPAPGTRLITIAGG